MQRRMQHAADSRQRTLTGGQRVALHARNTSRLGLGCGEENCRADSASRRIFVSCSRVASPLGPAQEHVDECAQARR
jgi:hypothetical protein